MKFTGSIVLIVWLLMQGVWSQSSGSSTAQCGIPKCKTCLFIACTACVSGYYVNLGSCYPCPINCETCNSSGVCSKCKTGFGLGNMGSCFKCTEGCGNCQPDNTCISCEWNYKMTTANGKPLCVYDAEGSAMVVIWVVIIVVVCCLLIICCVCMFQKDKDTNPAPSSSPSPYQPLTPNQGYNNQPQGYNNQPQGQYGGVQMGPGPGYQNYNAQQRYA